MVFELVVLSYGANTPFDSFASTLRRTFTAVTPKSTSGMFTRPTLSREKLVADACHLLRYRETKSTSKISELD